MKIQVPLTMLACLLLAAVQATAQTIYSNGPINGTTDAWSISGGYDGYAVSDTFSLGPGQWRVTGLNFAAWLFPGEVLDSVQVYITSSEFGGTTYFNQVLDFTQSGCSANQYGFNVCTETASIGSGHFSLSGDATYWLNFFNAQSNNGDPVYWDENSGPSLASENSVGTIPSEAFTVLGSTTTAPGPCAECSSSDSPSTVPEPRSIALFGSGILGLGGIVSRKMF